MPLRPIRRLHKPLRHLPHPLPTSVIHVVGRLRRAAVIHHLLRRFLQLILKIPPHHRQVRHICHIAVGVVGVGLRNRLRACPGKRCAAQAITLFNRLIPLTRFNQTIFLIVVAPTPPRIIRIGAPVDQVQDVAHLVIHILLPIAPHCLPITGMGAIHPQRIIMPNGNRFPTAIWLLPQMLPPRRLNQPIDGVVGVLRVGFHALIGKENRLLGVIPNVGNVPCRVVGVMQIL